MKKRRKREPKPLLDRLLDRTTRAPNGCWEVDFAVNGHDGYPKLTECGRGSRTLSTHRIAYALFCGDPGDSHVLHSCDNRRCVNPAHLRLGTHADNMRDKIDRGRASGGRWPPEVRARVREMLAAGVPKSVIARHLGVTRRGVIDHAKRYQLAAKPAPAAV
jgi:hypothetical protein